MSKNKKFIVGMEEWCELPELGIPVIKVKVDSGAKTSALHAFNIAPYEDNGKQMVKFDIHPIQRNRTVLKTCKAEVLDRRNVTNSGGYTETRYVIKTNVKMAGHEWEIEVTLTNRDSMGYRMLLGREAMKDRILVDPDSSFLQYHIKDKEALLFYKVKKREAVGLNIAILANNPELYSNKRMIEAAEVRGHNISFLPIRDCHLKVVNSKPEIYCKNKLIEDLDAVIPRIGASLTFYGTTVLRQFEASKVFCLNTSESILKVRDKLRSMQLLAEKNIAMPITGFAHSPDDTKSLIKMVGGAPLVVKLLEGTQGKGVVLAETDKAAESVINAFKSLKANILVQEFVKEADGKDLRCFVVGGKVVGSMQRVAQDGEFRANMHLGATALAVKITAEERRMAIKATKLMGLEIAGVDIIRSATGPKILEINSSPGLEGIEAISGIDIASQIIQTIEKRLK